MNLNRQWFICLQDDVIGPLNEAAILTLIHNQRLTGSDFVWREGLNSWSRVLETPELSSHVAKLPRTLPPYKFANTASRPEPKAAIPNRDGMIQRQERTPLEGWVRLDNSDLHRVINISETGLLVSIPQNVPIIGKEIRFRLESPAFGKPLELTGVLVREDFSNQENAVAIEFTRLNPAYRRMIKEYVQLNETKKAA